MPDKNQPLPSVNALRAFEAAARQLNFTLAAAELNLTQGAVSHQIRELESRLGVTLFNREARGISLTDEGKIYLDYVVKSLASLRAGRRALQPQHDDQILTVSCSPNFAHKWLVPRLSSFIEDKPSLDLRLSASARHVTFQNDGIDIAIRHGDGHWPELSVTRLCEEWIFPVCSPHVSPSIESVQSVDDLKRFTLLHDQQREGWANWFNAIGANPQDFNLDRGPIYSQTSFAIDAAVATQGVSLARSALVELDLQQGRLVRPVESQVPARFAYWIVCPQNSDKLPSIRRFRDWLLEQAVVSPGDY